MKAIIQARCQHKQAGTKDPLHKTVHYTLNTFERNILIDTDLELTSRKVMLNNIQREQISLKQN